MSVEAIVADWECVGSGVGVWGCGVGVSGCAGETSAACSTTCMTSLLSALGVSTEVSNGMSLSLSLSLCATAGADVLALWREGKKVRRKELVVKKKG